MYNIKENLIKNNNEQNINYKENNDDTDIIDPIIRNSLEYYDANQPKIQEILDKAGPQFARHDPSTWTQQAKLAAAGRWNDLETLKNYLVGGREPKKDEFLEIEVPIIETTSQIQSITAKEEIIFSPKTEPIINEESKGIAQVSEVIEETIPSFTQTPLIPIDNNLDSITEEMLEKVNKVKAAIRKAMVEKNETPVKDNTPLTTLNDVIAKNEGTPGSSFFDNL
jgi:cell division initiation protein